MPPQPPPLPISEYSEGLLVMRISGDAIAGWISVGVTPSDGALWLVACDVVVVLLAVAVAAASLAAE